MYIFYNPLIHYLLLYKPAEFFLLFSAPTPSHLILSCRNSKFFPSPEMPKENNIRQSSANVKSILYHYNGLWVYTLVCSVICVHKSHCKRRARVFRTKYFTDKWRVGRVWGVEQKFSLVYTLYKTQMWERLIPHPFPSLRGIPNLTDHSTHTRNSLEFWY